MEFSNLDPYSANLSDRIVAFDKIWQLREQYQGDAYTRIFDEPDFWDTLLHKEFSGQHGWHRLGSA
jgi:hypothetical protein